MNKNAKDYKGVYSEMIGVLGEDVVKKIHENYKGQQLTFPMKLYSKEYIERYIYENKDKKNIRELAKELGYSEKWIKSIISNNK